MALQDFIQALQEQDVVYSTPPQPSIRVIPPESQVMKIIPPESSVEIDNTPKVIKLKLKPKVNTNPTYTQPVQQPIPQPVQQLVQQPQPQSIPQYVQPAQRPIHLQPAQPQQNNQNQVLTTPTQQVTQRTVTQQPTNNQPTITTLRKPDESTIEKYVPKFDESPKELSEDDIFNNTGTEYSKKEIWLEYYNKAKSSRKSNPIVDRMKIGRFTITPDNKVLLLPDYDIVGKDPDDVIKDKWF